MQTGTVRRSVRGHLHDVAPSAFVQMIAIERETCALGVRADGRQGTLFFVAGDLCHAELGDLRGEEAAIQILGWDRADVETQIIAEAPRRSINAPLTFILLEAMRRRDEHSRPAGERATASSGAALQALAGELEGLFAVCLFDLDNGLPLDELSTADTAFDAGQLSRWSHDLMSAELAVLAALGVGSLLEEIVLTFGDLLLVIRPVRPGVALALAADATRLRLPAVHAALHRLGTALADGASTWRD